jgi:hypothetical protein
MACFWVRGVVASNGKVRARLACSWAAAVALMHSMTAEGVQGVVIHPMGRIDSEGV